MKLEKTTYLILTVLMAILLYSCANIGRPEGGERDQDPPIFIRSTPELNSLNVDKNKIVMEFDEIVTLKDQSTKVVISPVQKENPSIKALGHKVTVEFRDSLLPNTTYSIDFADAIQDNNENNPLEDFSFAFSTGDSIDSLAISGIVLRARDLEPMQKMMVGVHSNLEDSAFTKLKFDRISRTNDRGQFTIRNLKPGKYKVYALNDMDRDYKFARSEDLAFLQDIIVPSSHSINTMDTVFTLKHAVDTIIPGTHTVYTPNDVFLSMFNEGYTAQYLKSSERVGLNKLLIKMAAHSDTLPTLRIIDPAEHKDDWYRLERSEYNDSLVYWITDSSLIKSDSIKASFTYLRTDSTENLSERTDTLRFDVKKTFKRLQEKAQKLKEKEEKEKQKQEEREKADKEKKAKKRKKNKDNAKPTDEVEPMREPGMEDDAGKAEKDSVAKAVTLKFELKSGTAVDVDAPLEFLSEEPIDSINQKGFHLFLQKDSVWNEIQSAPLTQVAPHDVLSYKMDYAWEPGESYKIKIDSCSVFGIYGLSNETKEQQFKVKASEEYANLYFTVSVQDSAFVELLSAGDKVVKTAPVVKGTADFPNMMPGDYYARIVIDANGNGMWDTGNYASHLQPEEVYYYPKKIKLKKNWEVEQSWNIYELPVDKQKPDDIKKNKPTEKKKWGNEEKKKTTVDEEEDTTMPAIYTGNKYNDMRNNNR